MPIQKSEDYDVSAAWKGTEQGGSHSNRALDTLLSGRESSTAWRNLCRSHRLQEETGLSIKLERQGEPYLVFWHPQDSLQTLNCLHKYAFDATPLPVGNSTSTEDNTLDIPSQSPHTHIDVLCSHKIQYMTNERVAIPGNPAPPPPAWYNVCSPSLLLT